MPLVKPEDVRNASGEPNTTIKLKTPKRILHFSDGILEEYSTDEEDNAPPKEPPEDLVNPSTLTWGPWMWYKAWRAGVNSLYVMDSIGEYLAGFFGITTPKYYFELQEYRKREAEKNEEKKMSEGWSEPSQKAENLDDSATVTQPRAVEV